MNSLLCLQKCYRIPCTRNFISALCKKNYHIIPNETLLLKSYFPVSTQVRTFWDSFPYVRPLYYEKDGISRKHFDLIYRSKIFLYAFYSQLIGQTVLVTQCLGGLYYAYQSHIAQEVIYVSKMVGPFVVHYNLPTLCIIALLTLQNCVLIIAAQRAVLRVYYSEDTEKCVFVNLAVNPFKTKLTECKQGELVPLKDRPWNFLFGNHKVNGKKVYIRYDEFKNMYYYNNLLGDNCNKTPE